MTTAVVAPDLALQSIKPTPNKFRSSMTLARCIFAALSVAPAQYIWMQINPKQRTRLPRYFHRNMCRALGIDVMSAGVPEQGPVLYVANHISWSDIIVLGGQVIGSFVAKADVEKMPVLGTLANLQFTIYVERERRSRTVEQRNEITERLLKGHNIILFPEGTSSEGNTVLPFKSSLFSVVEDPALAHVKIQPVTLSYTHLNGLPIIRALRHKIGWIGDMDFGPHAWQLMGLGRIRALIQYHPAVKRSDFANRKELSKHCEMVTAKGLRLANAGRVSGEKAKPLH
jgi:lyso-ornithine lipid O-acyltransferase